MHVFTKYVHYETYNNTNCKTKMCVCVRVCVYTLFSFLISMKHLVYISHICIHSALETTVFNEDDCHKGAKTSFSIWLVSKTVPLRSCLVTYITYTKSHIQRRFIKSAVVVYFK